jgi:hypothetical protein
MGPCSSGRLSRNARICFKPRFVPTPPRYAALPEVPRRTLWVSSMAVPKILINFVFVCVFALPACRQRKNYPSVLFVTGDGDTRAAILHARKTAARLQAATPSGRPVLLLYDAKSGHSGRRPIKKLVEEDTDILSYLFWQMGIPAGTKTEGTISRLGSRRDASGGHATAVATASVYSD